MKVIYSREKDGETEEMSHFHGVNQTYILTRHEGKEKINEAYNEFIEKVKVKKRPGQRGVRIGCLTIEIAYVNIAGTYLPLPTKLANKKAIINVQNNDNECLKWALKATLLPVPNIRKE